MEESNRPRQQRYQQQSHQHHHHQKSKKTDNNNKNKKPLVIIGVLVLLVAVTAFGYHEVHKRKVLNLLAQEGIYHGITINGEDVVRRRLSHSCRKGINPRLSGKF